MKLRASSRGRRSRNCAPSSFAWIITEFDHAPLASSEQDTRVPRPLRSRASSAISTAERSAMPVGWSPLP